ncbi:hypothetical protein P691DRAFT_666806, partial [Macrolepiota fuliginosa MF-IS2]
PIDLVPNEILSLIFELGCFEDEVPDLCFRDLIEKISSRWRETAHHTPSLWSIYRLSQGNLDHMIDVLPVYLERSADHPLEIHLNCFWDPARTDRVMELFLRYSKRWRFLSITTPSADIFHYLHGISVPQLEVLQICHFSSQRDLPLDPSLFDGHLPSLRHLTLRNMSFKDTTLPLKHLHSLDIRGYGIWPDHAELNELIGGSTTLRKLALHVRPEAVLQNISPQEGFPIILPALYTFDVITSEWLSPQITTLCRTFSCPSMDSFSLKDSSVMTTTPPYDMVRYLRTGSVSHPDSPLLRVRACSLYHACRCLHSSRDIVTLELDDVRWSHWSNIMTVFASLPSLDSVIITNVEPTVALSDLGTPSCPFKIPSLKKLEVGVVKRKWDAEESDFAKFVRVFDVPALRFLAIRNISSAQWCHLLETFTERTGQCLELESLTVTNLQGGLDACPDPSSAFPNLQNLSLIRVPVNSILKRLVLAPSMQWPNLRNIAICGDPHASVPLLHRIITSRPQGSFTLYLDGHFQHNLESWNWLEENAEVILMPTIDPWKE